MKDLIIDYDLFVFFLTVVTYFLMDASNPFFDSLLLSYWQYRHIKRGDSVEGLDLIYLRHL